MIANQEQSLVVLYANPERDIDLCVVGEASSNRVSNG